MAYVVLARKYRPHTFAELVGQAPIVRTLGNAMAMDRVHHAFLLTGARGVGKTTTARLLARSLNCQKGPTLTPCDSCPSCQEIAHGSSASVVEIDGASNTGVDNVRELREGARYVPAVGRFKIYIVDEVHMLSQAAFNALLKVLEEPPAHVKFIFATTEPHKIPATILSRCQRFDFRRLDVPTLLAHLQHVLQQEGLQLEPAALQVIARQAMGSVRDALSLLDQVLSYAGENPEPDVVREALGAVDHRLLFALTDAIVGRNPAAMLALVAEMETAGHDLGQVMQLFLEHLRDVAVAGTQTGAQALAHRSQAEIEELGRQAKQRSQGDWQRLFDKSCDVAQAMRSATADKVVLEMGLLRLMHVAPAADLAQLLSRIDALLAGLPADAAGGAGGAGPGFGPITSTPEAHPASAFVTGPTLTESPELSVAPRPCVPGVPNPPAAPDAPDRLEPAAPAVAEAPAQASTVDDAACGFRTFVDKVRRARPSLASVLEHGQLVHFGADEVVLAFVPQTFWWDAVTDPDNKVLFESTLQQQLAAKVAWRVVSLEQGHKAKPSLAEERQQNVASAWEKTRAEASNHSVVRAATQILGAAVEDIQPAPNSP